MVTLRKADGYRSRSESDGLTLPGQDSDAAYQAVDPSRFGGTNASAMNQGQRPSATPSALLAGTQPRSASEGDQHSSLPPQDYDVIELGKTDEQQAERAWRGIYSKTRRPGRMSR